MFIQPFFEYKSEEWLAMVYGWPDKIERDSSFIIGFAFKTKKYAKEFFELLRAYNDGENIDRNNNIRLSLITENPETYSVYIYPSHERKNVKLFIEETKRKFGENHQLLITNLIICKLFPFGEGSTFKRFKDLYIEGNPVELYAFTLEEGNRPKIIKEIEPIIKYDIKIKNREELNQQELEYQHGKENMGK